jgi:hypothetical protein
VVEDLEIGVARLALNAAQHIQRQPRLQTPAAVRQPFRSPAQSLGVHLVLMVAGRAQEHGAGVGDLASEHATRHQGRGLGGIGPAVLLTPQEHIAGNRSLHSRQKTAALGEKAHGHSVLGAMAEQEGAARDLAKADDAAQAMNGQAQPILALHAHEHTFAILGQVGPLGGHVERVQIVLHSFSALLK